MAFFTFMQVYTDTFDVYRVVETIENGITKQERVNVFMGAPCRVYQNNTMTPNLSETAATVSMSNTLCCELGYDIQGGDEIIVPANTYIASVLGIFIILSALYIVLESPLNMLCDTPTAYTKERECLDFIAGVPTVWDETRALSGEIGEYVVIARRKGNDWYLGAITDWQPRDITIDLSFLGAGPHKAVVFQDGANAHRLASDYLRKEMLLDTALTVHLAPGGGFTAKISLAR